MPEHRSCFAGLPRVFEKVNLGNTFQALIVEDYANTILEVTAGMGASERKEVGRSCQCPVQQF
jgi:hypothetical protein